ncbi:MAG: hypothetical protein J1F41_01920 [Lachnospiraceae bacterium]|nr:hypothetical protein [Lachnospiraceae bacterium]
MQKWKTILMIMTAACIVAGCGSFGAKVPEMSTISIQKDGKIQQTIVDQFERNYYDADELEKMTQEKIERFSDGEESIICESVEENDGTIIVKMTYQTDSDYMDFNNRELFYGTVSDASAQGYSLPDLVSKDGTSISESELSGLSENHVVIIQTAAGEELDVNVYDKILYTSGNITLSGKKDAIIEAGEESTLSYIVFP